MEYSISGSTFRTHWWLLYGHMQFSVMELFMPLQEEHLKSLVAEQQRANEAEERLRAQAQVCPASFARPV